MKPLNIFVSAVIAFAVVAVFAGFIASHADIIIVNLGGEPRTTVSSNYQHNSTYGEAPVTQGY
jgi:hypothetical protein